jgi:hypothetical protein
MTTRPARKAAPAAEVPAVEPAATQAPETPGAAEPDAAAPGYEQDGAEHEPALDEAPTAAQPAAKPAPEPTARGALLLAEMHAAEDRWLAREAERHAELEARSDEITARLAAEADAMTADAMRAPRLRPLTRSAAEALAAAAPNNDEAVLAGIWAAYVACQIPAEHTHQVMSDAEMAAHLDGYSARAAWREPHRFPAHAA